MYMTLQAKNNRDKVQISLFSIHVIGYVTYTGSPFKIPVGEPPDPRKVRVYGPGVQDGLIQTFESKFLVETSGAGAGQLAVRIRGPRSKLKIQSLVYNCR